MEMVDIIDAAGRTIGTVSRQEMRGRRLPHRRDNHRVFCGGD